MATTNVTNSTLFVFKGGAAGATQVSHLTDFTINESMEPRDITTKDSGGHRYLLEGLRSYEVSIAGLVAFDATLGPYTTTTDSEANCTFSATLQGTGQYYVGTF